MKLSKISMKHAVYKVFILIEKQEVQSENA